MFGKAADLKPMVGIDGYYIGNVIHGAGIKVDNNGVKAAAYTGANTTTKAGGERIIYFNVDHPFAYTLTNKDGLPIFMGVMYNFDD